jgi:uncharacterized protein YcnI
MKQVHISRWGAFAASAAATLAATAFVASAHVTVWPKTSTVGAWEEYTMRVPTERDNPTTKVVLKIPAGVTFEQYEPVPGWSVSEHKDASGRVDTVTWQATGGGIAPGQFQTFPFVAQNPKTPGSLAWDAYQYYKDGTIVEWTGPEGAQTPHSITQILTSAPAAQTQTGAPAATPKTPAQTTAPESAPARWPMGLSIAALAVSIVSLIASLRSRRS